jgi:hypothetical protein
MISGERTVLSEPAELPLLGGSFTLSMLVQLLEEPLVPAVESCFAGQNPPLVFSGQYGERFPLDTRQLIPRNLMNLCSV